MEMWEYFDYTSIEPRIYIYGKSRYTTKFGALMTLISFMSIIVLSFFFLLSYINKVEVNVIFFEQNSDYISQMNFTQKIFFWKVIDSTRKTVDTRIIESIPVFIVANSSGTFITPLEIQKCSGVEFLNKVSTLNQFNLEDYYCIKENKYDLNMIWDSSNNYANYLSLYLRPCKNSTFNKITCSTQKEIDNFIYNTSMNLEYSFPNVNIDHFNVSNPIEESFTYINTRLYPSMVYKYLIKIKTINYTDDVGSVIEDQRTFTKHSLDSSRSYTEISPKGPKLLVPDSFAYLNIQLNSKTLDIFKRSYPKLQTVVANIGGILKFILTVAQIISRFISKKMMNIDLANTFTSFNITHGKNLHNNLNNMNLHNKSEAINMKTFKISDKKINKLNFIQCIIPSIFQNKYSPIKQESKCEFVIKSLISSDNLLKLFSQFEGLKSILFNKDQLMLFNNLKKPYIDEIISHLKNKDCEMDINSINKGIENLINKERLESEIDKRLLNLLKL